MLSFSSVTARQPPANLQTFVHEYLLYTGRRCFLVAEHGEVTGLLIPNEVKGIAKERWPYTTGFDVMRPLERLKTVTPETPISKGNHRTR